MLSNVEEDENTRELIFSCISRKKYVFGIALFEKCKHNFLNNRDDFKYFIRPMFYRQIAKLLNFTIESLLSTFFDLLVSIFVREILCLQNDRLF